MNAEFFAGHFAYSRWATLRILDACLPLTLEELNRPLGNSFGGVLGTLVHIFRADRIWLERLKGNAHAPYELPGESFTLPVLRNAWTIVLEELQSVAAKLTDEEI